MAPRPLLLLAALVGLASGAPTAASGRDPHPGAAVEVVRNVNDVEVDRAEAVDVVGHAQELHSFGLAEATTAIDATHKRIHKTRKPKLSAAMDAPNGPKYKRRRARRRRRRKGEDVNTTVVGPRPARPLTAFCVVGNSRTFPSREVYTSLGKFLGNLSVAGTSSPTRADLFVHMTLQTDQSKEAPWGVESKNNSREDIEKALDTLNPVSVRLSEEAGKLTMNNIDDFVKPDASCFKRGFWGSDHRYLVRSMNQLLHLQECIDTMMTFEKEKGVQYDLFMLSRPEMVYSLPVESSFLDDAFAGRVPHEADFFLALNREKVQKLIEPDRARPFVCEGDCCDHMDRSEKMFTHLLSAPICWRTSIHVGKLMGGPFR